MMMMMMYYLFESDKYFFLIFIRELDNKLFVDPIRGLVAAHLKQEPDRSRTPTSKELPRLYMESPHAKQQQQPPRMPVDTPDRASKYKEENRRILQESIEVAPFTAKIRPGEPDREPYSRIPSLSKGHGMPSEKEPEHPASELYKYKHSATQSLPQSNYFTTLSNSVVNEPPRLYPSKELNLFDKTPASSSPLGSYSGAKSLSKPPPLIKHQPEGEGLVGKISEQLSQQVALHSLSTSAVAAGGDRRSPAISPSGQLRSMPALHRAPVFHPPTQQTLDRKEAGYGRLSPPTLTPIQPVSTAAGKASEQQKPPTLLPELREVKGGLEQAEPWRASTDPQALWHQDKGRGKPQAAVASVIVRPSTCKYDGAPGSKPATKETTSGRPSPVGRNQLDSPKPSEARDSSRIIQSNTNLEDVFSQYKKNIIRASQGSFPSSVVAVVNSVCNSRTDVSTSASAISVLSRGTAEPPLSAPSSSSSSSSTGRLECTSSKCKTPTGPELQESGSRTTSPRTQLPPASQAYSGNFIHPKKHKAALAAAQSRGSSSASESESSGRSSQDSPTITAQETSKPSPLPNGQPPMSQPNYHKLKKAWLTRHSEEDRNTNKTEKTSSIVSEIIKPCTVNLIASTSGETELAKDGKGPEDNKMSQEDRKSRRGATKRSYESASDSGDDSDASDSKLEQRAKRQPKPTYKKKQNDMQKKKGDNDKEDDDVKPNGIFRSAKEKTKLKLASSSKFMFLFFFFGHFPRVWVFSYGPYIFRTCQNLLSAHHNSMLAVRYGELIIAFGMFSCL